MSTCACPICGSTIELKAFQGGSSPKRGADADTSELKSLIDSIYPEELESDYERKFMADLALRYEKYGETTKMSEKQMSVLRKIAAR